MTAETAAPASKPTIVNPSTLHDPSPLGYSTAIVAPAGGRLAFLSGQGGQDASGTLSPDFQAQVSQAFANLTAALEGVGASADTVMKLTVYVVDHDMGKLPILTQTVTAIFGAALPTQTLVPVPRLAVDGMLFEVEAIAHLP